MKFCRVSELGDHITIHDKSQLLLSVLSVNTNMHLVYLFIYLFIIQGSLGLVSIVCEYFRLIHLDQNNIPVSNSCDIVTKLLVSENMENMVE
jgi:hypothetical protein